MTDQSEIRADLGVVDTDVLIWFKSKDTQSKINIDPEDIKPEMADCIDYLYSYLQINAERECWQSDDDLRLKHFRIVFSAGSKIKAFQIAKKKDLWNKQVAVVWSKRTFIEYIYDQRHWKKVSLYLIFISGAILADLPFCFSANWKWFQMAIIVNQAGYLDAFSLTGKQSDKKPEPEIKQYYWFYKQLKSWHVTWLFQSAYDFSWLLKEKTGCKI